MGEEKEQNGKTPRDSQSPSALEYFRLWRGGGNDEESIDARLLFLGTIRDLSFIAIYAIPLVAGAFVLANGSNISLTFGLLTAYLELLSIFAVVVSRMRLRDLQATRRSQEFEDRIFGGSKDTPVVLFLKHQSDLKRYYDQALQHSSLVFFLGIFCVLAGLGTIGVAAFLVAEAGGKDAGSDQMTEQIITGALGAVGAILSGFVAKVYLGIHHGSIESLNDFHDKLVQTHHLHFAGVLAARVEDGTTRDQAHLELVKRVPASHLALAPENAAT